MLTIASRIDVMNRLGRAMADPNRSRILLSLLEAPGHPAQLSRDLDLSRTNVSNHLACLRGCGLVVATPEGRRTRYEIADPHLSQALEALVNVVVAVDDGEVACVEERCTVPGCSADCSDDDSDPLLHFDGGSGREDLA
ncbi:Cd(II)/Pb(II)-sensing metalloregulatory transcriptional regulator CmtR [Corynebacterium kalidii]|uniref:Metalloregulator ArsR/SmtB family transcription factor n=1 Tax=Corynebacterium kalidii TaxID=2931982 RepID=A0A9X1WPM6_9CORY|nr:metalloregulator ArsR/SmtB family transcription factor [Corynebacterium kalidii]MCJ7858961.1 metalloregulator ArsR/SmtB family transcription factor [Corynebacterium kalidii]